MINTIPIPAIKTKEDIYVSNLDEMIDISKDDYNLQRNIIYRGIIYKIMNTTPMWSINLGDHTLTITNIHKIETYLK